MTQEAQELGVYDQSAEAYETELSEARKKLA
jgi:hypothetical protein